MDDETCVEAARRDRRRDRAAVILAVVVIAICGYVIGFGRTTYGPHRARLTWIKADLMIIKAAALRYRIHHQGRFPKAIAELQNSFAFCCLMRSETTSASPMYAIRAPSVGSTPRSK